MVLCTKENLFRGLTLVERAMGRNISLPVLANVAIRFERGKMIFTATDLELAAVAVVPAKSEGDDAFTVPLRELSGFVSALPEDIVQLKRSGKTIVISSGAFKGIFQGGSIDDFPIVPELREAPVVHLDASPFIEALEHVAVATAFTETRPELTGVALSVEGNTLQLAATDTFRLALRVLSYTQPESFSVILPHRTAREVVRLFKQTKSPLVFQTTEHQCVFSAPGLTLTSRLIEGAFPAFRAILPKEWTARLRVPKAELLKRLEAASFFTSRFNDVKVTLRGTAKALVIAAESPGIGSYETELSGEEGEGEEQTISVNLRYLTDGLSGIRTNDVIVETNGHTKPAVLRPHYMETKEDMYLMMPIRPSA